jgi:hypothetical protein
VALSQKKKKEFISRDYNTTADRSRVRVINSGVRRVHHFNRYDAMHVPETHADGTHSESATRARKHDIEQAGWKPVVPQSDCRGGSGVFITLFFMACFDDTGRNRTTSSSISLRCCDQAEAQYS